MYAGGMRNIPINTYIDVYNYKYLHTYIRTFVNMWSPRQTRLIGQLLTRLLFACIYPYIVYNTYNQVR